MESPSPGRAATEVASDGSEPICDSSIMFHPFPANRNSCIGQRTSGIAAQQQYQS